MEKTTSMTGKGLQLTYHRSDSTTTVRDFVIPTDVSLLAKWINLLGNQVPKTFVDQISKEYTSFLSQLSFQLYILEREGASIIIAEIYLSSFAGMLPVAYAGKEDAILLKCYFNPMEDADILNEGYAHLVQLLHTNGIKNIWVDPTPDSLENVIARNCGFTFSKDHQMLLHQQ